MELTTFFVLGDGQLTTSNGHYTFLIKAYNP